MRTTRNACATVVMVAALAASACAPMTAPAPAPLPAGLPPVAAVDGPLEIRVVHPTAATVRPNVDSTFVFGSVGTGRASLSINGAPVPVAPNGAFLAFLPVPADGTYQLSAEAGGRTATATRAYQPQAAGGSAAAPTTVEFPEPRAGRVTGGADTVATGSDAAVGRPTPTGSYRWFLPRGARVTAMAQRGDMVRVRLDTATAWFPANAITFDAAPAPAATAALQPARVQGATEWVDVRIPAGHGAFLVEPTATALRLTVYGRTAPGGSEGADPLIAGLTWRPAGPASAQAEIALSQPLWGFLTFYTPEGDLVVRVRRPPSIDPAQPLRGIRVLIDPGHPPGGAIGPTGLTEAEANLAISLPLAEQLRRRGAEVLMTRTTGAPMVSATSQAAELGARVRYAVESNAHLLVSVHNNAFGEGVNPFRNHGTSTYHFHPHSADLARALNAAIVRTTLIRDLGARTSNLAMVRPTWMPTALTESLFMMLPEQEAALRNPAFIERLAAAHVAGLEEFLRGRAGAGSPR